MTVGTLSGLFTDTVLVNAKLASEAEADENDLTGWLTLRTTSTRREGLEGAGAVGAGLNEAAAPAPETDPPETFLVELSDPLTMVTEPVASYLCSAGTK